MKQLSFKNRIRLGFLFLFLLMLCASIYSILQFKKIDDTTETLYNHPILVRKTIKDIEIELFKKAHLTNDILFTRTNNDIDSLNSVITVCDSNLEKYFAIVYSRYLGKKSDVASAYAFYQSWNPTISNLFRCKRENKMDSAKIYLNIFNKTNADKITLETSAIAIFAEHKTDELVNTSIKIEHTTIQIKIIILLFIFIAGLVISLIITNSIINPLQKFLNAAKNMFRLQTDVTSKKFETEEELFELTLQALHESYQKIEQQNEEMRIINEQLEKANTSLEQKVAERTKELHKSLENERSLKEMYHQQGDELQEMNHEYLSLNEELKANLDEIAALNEQLSTKINDLNELVSTKDKFFSIIAHDLRSPFNAILGFSDLLANSFDEYSLSDIHLFAHSMNEVSRNTFALLENLLDWSRVQIGSLIAQPVDIKSSAVAKTVISLCEPNAQAKNIVLRTIFVDDEIIIADKDMLTTVLRNIISNAVKFTYPKGSVSIETRKQEDILVFAVSDTGIGIEPKYIDALFEVNSVASKQGTANEKGTGLGLLLCKELVEKNGGRIWVESELGKGSTFSFSVPLSNKTTV